MEKLKLLQNLDFSFKYHVTLLARAKMADIVVALSLVFSDGLYVVPAVHNAARNKLNYVELILLS